MRKGHFKVAESYILYRARRRIERETGATGDEVKQDSMIVVKKKLIYFNCNIQLILIATELKMFFC